VAHTDHVAEDTDELTFRAGDEIEVLRAGDARGWWYGRVLRTRQKGHYPSLFTRSIDVPAPESINDKQQQTQADDDTVHVNKLLTTSSESNAAPRARDTTSFDETVSLRTALAGDVLTPRGRAINATVKVDDVYLPVLVAKYPYEACDTDELTFSRGERIIVVQEGEDGESWWAGMLQREYEELGDDATVGLFARSYCSVPGSEQSESETTSGTSGHLLRQQSEQVAVLVRALAQVQTKIDGLRKLCAMFENDKRSRREAQKELNAVLTEQRELEAELKLLRGK